MYNNRVFVTVQGWQHNLHNTTIWTIGVLIIVVVFSSCWVCCSTGFVVSWWQCEDVIIMIAAPGFQHQDGLDSSIKIVYQDSSVRMAAWWGECAILTVGHILQFSWCYLHHSKSPATNSIMLSSEHLAINILVIFCWFDCLIWLWLLCWLLVYFCCTHQRYCGFLQILLNWLFQFWTHVFLNLPFSQFSLSITD